MNYFEVTYGLPGSKFLELRFSETEKLINESKFFVSNYPGRYSAITFASKLVYACYWDETGFRQFQFAKVEDIAKKIRERKSDVK